VGSFEVGADGTVTQIGACQKYCGWRRIAVPLMLLSLAAMLIAILIPQEVDRQLDEIVYLTDTDSFGYPDFINQTDTYLDYYMFDVVNPVDVVVEGANPSLNQVGPFRYKSVSVRYVTVFGTQAAPGSEQQLSDVTYYEWNYFQNIVCRGGIAYPSLANVISSEPWPNSDSSWCATGDTLDENNEFVTSVDLAYQGVLQQGTLGYMPKYPILQDALASIPTGGLTVVPGPDGPLLLEFLPAYMDFGEAAVDAIVSLLVAYTFPAAGYDTGEGREDLPIPVPPQEPATPLGVNPIFYSLDLNAGFQSVTNCEALDAGEVRDDCYGGERAVCGTPGGYASLISAGAADEYFDCAPRGSDSSSSDITNCSSANPVPVSRTQWGCEPGLFIRRPVRDFIAGYQSPTLVRLNAGCLGFIKKSLVDELLGAQVCGLFTDQYCLEGQPDLANIPPGTPRDLLNALCGLQPGQSCVDLSDEYNEILAEGFCQAFPSESPGLLLNTTTPEAGIAAGVQRYYSGEGANNLARYFTTFNGENRNVVFDDALDDTVARDAWSNLEGSDDFSDWRGSPAGQSWQDPNIVAGHAVSQIPKGTPEGATVDFFIPAIQRNLRFQNTGGRKSTVKGLETLVFDILGDELVPYTSMEPNTEGYFRNQAFYSGGQRVCITPSGVGCNTNEAGVPIGFESWAMPAGNVNISTVKLNAPLFASRPYWYDVENLDSEATIGSDVLVYEPTNCEDLDSCTLRPMSESRNDPGAADRFASKLNIYERMGFTIGANVRLQINAALSPMSSMAQICTPLAEPVVQLVPVPNPLSPDPDNPVFGFFTVTITSGCLFGQANEEGLPLVIGNYLLAGLPLGGAIPPPPPGVSCDMAPPDITTFNLCNQPVLGVEGCEFTCGFLSQDGAVFGPYFPELGAGSATSGSQFVPIAYYDQNALLSDDQADLLVEARDLKKYSFQVGWSLFAIFAAAGIGCFAYGTWRKRHPQEAKLWSGQPMASGSFAPRTDQV
jgi:hypothetical protein